MFHGVDATGSVLSLRASELDSLLRSILRSGHRVVPLDELLGSPGRDVLSLTFDDGFASVALEGARVIADLGLSATLFLTTGRVGSDNAWPSQPTGAPRFPMMNWDQLESLQRSGWSIEAHSMTHPDLRLLSDGALEDELARPLEEIERRLGRRPTALAYPYGYYDARVRRVACRLYRTAVTTNFAALRPTDDPHALPRLDTYYLRSARIHRHFGNSPAFLAYLGLRGFARRIRNHPGELREKGSL